MAVGTSTRCSGLSWHGSRSTSVPSVGKCQLHWLVAKSPKMTQIICDGSVMAMPHDENEDARFCHNCGAPLPLPRVPAVAWPSAPVTANALHQSSEVGRLGVAKCCACEVDYPPLAGRLVPAIGTESSTICRRLYWNRNASCSSNISKPTEYLFVLCPAFEVTGEGSRVAINLGEATRPHRTLQVVASAAEVSWIASVPSARGMIRLLQQLRWKPSTKRVR